nr:response regulator [Deinobacterium chartae]
MVEDEPDIQTVARLALETVGGLEVSVCSSGHEALALLERGSLPDLVLLDVMMPGMDGPTTLTEIHARPALRALPVVFMTARVQRHEVEEYRQLGAIGVVPKPFDPMTLASTLRELWREARARAVQPVPDVPDDFLDEMERLRQMFRDRREDRLDRLDRALLAYHAGQPDELRRTVHTFAGSAGTLGFREIERAAREVEAALEAGDSDLPERLDRLRAVLEA